MKSVAKSVYLPKSKYPRIVVVGAGFAGIHFAKPLKGKPFQVVLLDRNNFHQFQPLLYQVATSGLEPDAIVFPLRKFFRDYRNVTVRMAEVFAVNSKNNEVETDIGVVPYDYLVLATGSSNNFYGLQDVEEGSIGLKTIQEALDLRSNLLQNLEKATQTDDDAIRKQNTTVVIVGAGPAGVEMAGALAEFKRFIYKKDYPELADFPLTIYLVEAADEVLGAMSDKSSADSQKVLEKLGVHVLLKTAVKSFKSNAVTLDNGQKIPSANLIWTAGVKGQLPEGLPSEIVGKGNRIEVDEHNKVKGFEDIFALGDMALMQTEAYPHGHPMVAPAAIQQGEHLAKNLLKTKSDWEPFKYTDKGSLATIGKKRAVADFGKMHLRGWLAWVIWSTVHLISISGFKNKLRVGLNWISNYYTYDKGNRLIIRKYKR